SQTSPAPLPSLFSWCGFTFAGQLSDGSSTPSPSRSAGWAVLGTRSSTTTMRPIARAPVGPPESRSHHLEGRMLICPPCLRTRSPGRDRPDPSRRPAYHLTWARGRISRARATGENQKRGRGLRNYNLRYSRRREMILPHGVIAEPLYTSQ